MNEMNNAAGSGQMEAKSDAFVTYENANVLSAAVDELAGLEFTFDRIRMPSDGDTVFEVPDGDTDRVVLENELTCIILFHHPAYTYYRKSYDGGTNPPDCGSFDGLNGIGDPGGACISCPLNQFGSGNGQGKACKNRRMLYILRENEMIPMMLSLPTGSLKEFVRYFKRQLSRGRRLSQIVTKISLKKVSNSSGNAFSQASFRFERVLTGEERAAVSIMTEAVKEYASKLTVAALAVPEEVPPFVDAETGEILPPFGE